MDQSKNAIVDLIHIYDERTFISKDSINDGKITIAEDKNNKEKYFLIKKGEELDPNTNQYLFINHCEKSFELIHPSVLNLSGYLTYKPYLYYKFLEYPKTIDQIELSNINIQIIFLGIASGLSYLLSKGFYYDNFSISSIIFENFYPKLIDYINIKNENSVKNNETIVINYVDIMNYIIDMRKREDPDIIIDDKLQKLINRTQQRDIIPSLNEFISFFKSNNYCKYENKSLCIIESSLCENYIKNLEYDNIILCTTDFKFIYRPNSIEGIYYNLYISNEEERRRIFQKRKKDQKNLYLLNLFPDCYIKSFSSFLTSLSKKLKKFLFYEDQIFSNPSSSPFAFYKKLIFELSDLDRRNKDSMHLFYIKKNYEARVNVLRINAIYYLKQATLKEEEKVKSTIELSMQYINGSILPFNLDKASDILTKITDQKHENLINQIRKKIESAKKSNKKMLSNLPPKKKEIIQKANNGDVLSMLFAGFSLYYGFDGFPILHSESIKYYRKAAQISTSAMTLLGYLYLNGIIFPQNSNRAKNCFQRAADKGDIKAGIIDSLIRRHVWRTYKLDFDIDTIFHQYLPSFESMISNDAMAFPKLVYSINDIYDCKLIKIKNKLHSERDLENYSMSIVSELSDKIDSDFKEFKRVFSPKIVLYSENIEKTNDVKLQMMLAKSYFYGINGYPVNYSKAISFFKKAADNNDSEAQWFYALMCYAKLGTDNIDDTEIYLKKSCEQNNLKGKLLLAIYYKQSNNDFMFEQLIQECCRSQSPEAMYFYAMHIENNKSNLDQPMSYYQQSADLGNFYSLIRLIYLTKHELKNNNKNKQLMELFKKYTTFSVSLFNESLLIKAIIFYDKCKNFKQSNILIQIGMKFNYPLFAAFYADHLLHGKGIEMDKSKAEKIAYLAYQNNYPKVYFERYIYIMLDMFMERKQHKEAVDFLINHMDSLTEKFRRKYLFFFRKLDKNIAHENFITINFLNDNYKKCFKILIELKTKDNKNNGLKLIADLKSEINENNPYAMSTLGKVYKKGKYALRNLKKAVKLFALSAQNKCPEGYYYLGKEFYYGRILDQQLELAEKYLKMAFINYGEPKAGYYLYKLPAISNIEYLKISASFGYRKALYKYGLILLENKSDEIIGKRLIQQAALQNYKKASTFIKKHNEIFEQNDSDLNNNLKYNYNIIPSKINDEFADDESDDEYISNLINIIKNKKNNQNDCSNDDDNDDGNSDNDENILNIIQMLNDDDDSSNIMNNINFGDNVNKLTLKDLKEYNENSYKIKSDDIDNLESKDKQKDKKSSHKIDIDNDDDFTLEDLKKDKKSSYKIGFEDIDNLTSRDLKKDKKSSLEINIDDDDNDNFPLKDLKKNKKRSKISSDSEDLDISDLMSFWK